MITDTRAAEAIEKPQSRLSWIGLTRTDWALFALALFMGALALLSVIDTPQPDAIRVLVRLVALIGLVAAAMELVRTGNPLEPSERRAWHAIAIGTAVYAMAITVRWIDGLRLIEVDRCTREP